MPYKSILSLSKLIPVWRFKIVGDSMRPTFNAGTHVLVKPTGPNTSRRRRGEVVVITDAQFGSFNYFKRIIGLPGEHILLSGNNVYINGTLLDEPYVAQHCTNCRETHNNQYTHDPNYTYRLALKEYFMLGDNRPQSTDSRTLGPVKETAIIGKAWFRYWPVQAWGFIQKVEYSV